jgi:hypothetical protein
MVAARHPRGAWTAVLVWLLALAGLAPAAAAQGSLPVVKELGTRTLVNGVPTIGAPIGYCLFLAGDRTEPDYLVGTGTIANLSLVHPVPQVNARMELKAKKRWYAAVTGSAGGVVASSLKPLLTGQVWRTIPARLRHVVDALGVDDAELVLVSSNLNTGSISVYFVPAHDKDRAFYQEKRDLLEQYIHGHDMDAELSLAQVLGS